MSRPIVSGTLLVLLALAARPALAGTYTYVDLGVSGELATGTGINAAGQVVGSVFDTTAHTYRAFVWQAGQLTMVLGPKASYSLNFNAINDAGLVVGSYSNNHTPPTFYETAVIYDIKTGQFTFPAQSFAQSSLAAVSAGGEAVGVVNQGAAGVPSALVVKNGVATTVTPSPDALNPFFDGITGGVA